MGFKFFYFGPSRIKMRSYKSALTYSVNDILANGDYIFLCSSSAKYKECPNSSSFCERGIDEKK